MDNIYMLLGLEGTDLQNVDANMLITALTLPSFGSDNYEAYEFIGDAVLSLIISQVLHDMGVRSPDKMTKIRSLVTKNSTLACMVISSGIDKRVLGGPKLSEKTKADIFESILGAIYLWARDNLPNPIQSVQSWIVNHWNIKEIIQNILHGMSEGDSSTRNKNIPLLSFMKTGEFSLLSDQEKKAHLYLEIELARSIKPHIKDDLEKIYKELLSTEPTCEGFLKSTKTKIYNLVMKEKI